MGRSDRETQTWSTGAFGSAIVTLLWFYLSTMALMIGGFVNAELERHRGAPQPIARCTSSLRRLLASTARTTRESARDRPPRFPPS
jgi:uncharacterized BrkB/YihY/UPF0761 family membrane protein